MKLPRELGTTLANMLKASHPNPLVPPTKLFPTIYRMKPPSSYRFLFIFAAVSYINESRMLPGTAQST